MKTFFFKKNISAYTIVALTLIFLSSCSQDWLDAKPDKTKVVPEDLADFQGLLDNFAAMNVNLPLSGAVASDNYSITDASFNNQEKTYRTDAYRWTKTMRYENNSDWDISYSRVLIDNIILDGLPKVPVITTLDQQDWNNVKGQALFHRAYLFFCLLQTFAVPYNEATASSDQGIPLRTTSDITIPSKRNTIKECYELITHDIAEAANLLPEKAKILTRASKASAHALLSRVYLSMGDYENSLLHATTCLGMHDTLLDLNNLPMGRTYIGRFNAEVLYHCTYGTGIISNGMVDLSFYNSIPQDDLRKTRFFTFRASSNTAKFIGNYESSATVMFTGLATDEVYLNKAESLARLGRTAESIDILNTLTRTRWNKDATYPEFEASSPEEALTLILSERIKELFFRGLRWMDLRRLNKDPRFAQTLTRTVNGETFTIEPNSFKYTFPIPDDIIEQTGMQQNSGWEK